MLLEKTPLDIKKIKSLPNHEEGGFAMLSEVKI